MSEEQVRFVHLFPTVVLTCILPGHERLNAELLDYISGLREVDTTGARRSNALGWHSLNLDFNAPVVAKFMALVLERAQEYGIAFSWRFPQHMKLCMQECWANVNCKFAYNDVHNHPNSLLSGVYYVKASGNCGQLSLLDPRKQANVMLPGYAERTPLNSPLQRFAPEVGRLVIFPSWLEHGVDQNLSEEDRVSVSFNIDLLPEELINAYP